jgi:undecaprenyl-diphosphatase
MLVCLAGFGLIAWQVSQPGIPLIDTAFTDFLHGLASPPLDLLMTAVTNLGSSTVLAAGVGLGAVLLVVRQRRAEAVFIVFALVGTLVLNDGLKLLFQRPRPGFDWAAAWPETGFPSGHSMNSLVVYVAIAVVIWRLEGRRAGVAAAVLAMLLTVSVGVSRVYLGAHWLTDVVGGYLAAALWLLFLIAASMAVSGMLRSGGARATAGDRDAPSEGSRRAR